MKLLIPFCLISLLSFGQEVEPIDKNRLNIRLAPFSLLDRLNSPCYKGGIEVNLYRNTSLTFDIGGYFHNYKLFSDIKGHIVDVGIRQYMVKEDNSGMFIMANLTYKNQAFNYTDSFDLNPTVTNTFRTQKYVSTLNLSIGYLHKSKRLTLEYFAGLGIRLKTVRSTLTKDDLDLGIDYRYSQTLYYLVTPDKYVLPNIYFGVRVGFRLK